MDVLSRPPLCLILRSERGVPVAPSAPVVIRVKRRPRRADTCSQRVHKAVADFGGVGWKGHSLQVWSSDKFGITATGTGQKWNLKCQTLKYGIRQVIFERWNDRDA